MDFQPLAIAAPHDTGHRNVYEEASGRIVATVWASLGESERAARYARLFAASPELFRHARNLVEHLKLHYRKYDRMPIAIEYEVRELEEALSYIYGQERLPLTRSAS